MVLLVAALVGAFVLAHTAPFPFLLEGVAGRGALWRVPPRDGTAPTVFLTFDDGPNPTATYELLDVLGREGARATFFLIPKWVTPATAPLVSRMFADGHGVALHSADRWLMARSPRQIAERLTADADRIEQLTGRRPCRAFRPHGGWRSGAMYAGLRRVDHRLVGWGWFAWDWNWFRPRTADAIASRVLARASDGLIVVIHDGHHRDPRAERDYAAAAAASLVPALRARGFRFGTICDVVEPGWPAARDPGPTR